MGQYAPILLPGEPPDRGSGRPLSTGSQRVGHDKSRPVCIDARLFFACGNPSPLRVEYESGAAAWLAGTLVVPSVQGHRMPSLQELRPYQSLFLSFL